MSSYYNQAFTELIQGDQVARMLPSAGTVSPGEASGGQYILNGQQMFISPDAVGSYTTPDNIPAYTTRGVYPSQIYPQQEAMRFNMQSFGHTAYPPLPEWVLLGRQQQWLLQQQQYSSWMMAPLPSGNVEASNDAAYVTQNSSQVYSQPPFIHYPPPANSGIISHGSENSFIASGTGFFTPVPHMTDNSPR
ncbi:hypothetical protein PBY51_005266 [Eleginops maclovinus]|uniref:Uncharacterized protein n=1 Tax=Eleginops maclovinus TaxID=56733 RepID=A0AAN8AHE6_ELEMC|nr:hypothetical protein PBY51_005266 [Eleginops maclovinus]